MKFFDAASFLILFLSFQYTTQNSSGQSPSLPAYLLEGLLRFSFVPTGSPLLKHGHMWIASGSPLYDNTTLSPITSLSSTILPLTSTSQLQSIERSLNSGSPSIAASHSDPAASLITSLSLNNLTGLTSTNVSTAAIHTLDVPGGIVGKVRCTGNLPPSSLSYPVGTRVQALARVSTAGIDSLVPVIDGDGFKGYTVETFTEPSTLYTTITQTLYPQLQPYVDLPDCCGQCRLYINLVDVFYWPVPGANSACLSGSTTITSQASLPSSGVRVRAESLIGNGSYAVGPDGYTYTSPSIYIAYHDISASNFCGQIGAKHTSVTLAFDPGEVSTLVGVPVHGGGRPESFNFADLPCPPQSLMDVQNADRGAYILPILPYYAPIIAAPSKLLNLDPGWKDCAQNQFIAFDPPKALTPVAALDPGMTTTNPIMDPTPAAPNSAPKGLPEETGSTITKMVSSAKNNDPTNDQARTSVLEPTASIQRTNTVDPPLPSGPKQKPDDSQSTSANWVVLNGGSPKYTSFSSNVDSQDPNKQSEDHQQHTPSSASVDPSTSLGLQPGSQGAPNAPVVVVQGHTTSETSLAVVVDGSSAAPSSDFIDVGSNAAPTPMPTLQPNRTPDPVVVGGLYFTPAPKGQGAMTVPAVIVQGQTLSENGPSATIGGNNVIYSAGFIHVGTYAAPAPSLIPQQLQTASALQVVDGLTISPIPASSAQSDATPITVAVQTAAAGTNDEVIIDSHTVLAGDSPITVSGRPVSLGSAGLVVGTVTYNLPPSSSGLRQLPVTTIDGHTIQSRPGGAIAVDGMSLSAGGPPITVSGTPVSLGSEGLVVGTATYTLSPSLAGSEESPIATIDGQTIQSGPDGAIKIDGMSLSAGGPPITISGTPISLGLSSLAIGTNVVPLPTSSNGGGLGEIILSGLGPVGPTVTSTSANSSVNVQMFTGSQDKVDIPSPAQLLFANACLVVLGMFI